MSANEGQTIPAEVRQTAGSTDYEIGAEINGAWISFGRRPGTDVDSAVANVQANAQAQGTGTDEPAAA